MAKSNVLAFLRRPSNNDWTQQELAEFYRVVDALLQGGLSVTTDRGISDEGDPWFIFCRADNEEIIAHFARIDHEYVVVLSIYQGVARGYDFRLLIRRMIDSHPLMLPIKRRQGQKIYVHPAALLTAMLVSAYFFWGEREGHGGNASSDGSSKNASTTSLLTQKFAILAAVGLAVTWVEHQAESLLKLLDGHQLSASLDDGVTDSSVANNHSFDLAAASQVSADNVQAQRADSSNSNLQNMDGHEHVATIVAVKPAAADDANFNSANAASLSANKESAAGHVDAQVDASTTPGSGDYRLPPARNVVQADLVHPNATAGSTTPTLTNEAPPSSSATAPNGLAGDALSATAANGVSSDAFQLAASITSSSTQPVILSNGTESLDSALHQAFSQVGFDTASDSNPTSPTNSSPPPSSTVVETTAATSVSASHIEKIVEAFIQSTPSFEIAISGSNVLIVDTKISDAQSADFGVRTWDLSDGSTLSIVGIIPPHHHAVAA
jgi:hypothetical protein